jgi:hypothetical protein
MEIKLKVWLEKDGHILFAKGRDRLLRAIHPPSRPFMHVGLLKKAMSHQLSTWGL